MLLRPRLLDRNHPVEIWVIFVRVPFEVELLKDLVALARLRCWATAYLPLVLNECLDAALLFVGEAYSGEHHKRSTYRYTDDGTAKEQPNGEQGYAVTEMDAAQHNMQSPTWPPHTSSLRWTTHTFVAFVASNVEVFVLLEMQDRSVFVSPAPIFADLRRLCGLCLLQVLTF